jgi:NADPH2:quinone reductase
MQAAVVTEFGAPEVLVASEVSDPAAGAGEVVIDVVAADVLWGRDPRPAGRRRRLLGHDAALRPGQRRGGPGARRG